MFCLDKSNYYTYGLKNLFFHKDKHHTVFSVPLTQD